MMMMMPDGSPKVLETCHTGHQSDQQHQRTFYLHRQHLLISYPGRTANSCMFQTQQAGFATENHDDDDDDDDDGNDYDVDANDNGDL